jgi:thiopeptide-type bacteriocin biosynthesis protein
VLSPVEWRRPDIPSKTGPQAQGGLYEAADWCCLRVCGLPIHLWPPKDKALQLYRRSSELRCAIGLASRSLADALATSPVREKAIRKLERYLSRMATRPTPFGLFSGVGVVRFDETTEICLDKQKFSTRSRPDMELLSAFVSQLRQETEVLKNLVLVINPSLVRHGGRAFLLSRYRASGPEVSVRSSRALELVLELAANPVSYVTLEKQLSDCFPESGSDAASGFIKKLVSLEFLVTDLEPCLIDSSPADGVLKRLSGVPPAAEDRAHLRALIAKCSEFDQTHNYEDLMRATACAHEFGFSVLNAIQVDARANLSERRLSRVVAREASRAAELLLRLSKFSGGGPKWLANLRKAFLDRHGVEGEVPLINLFDDLDLEPGTDDPGRSDEKRLEILYRLAQDAAVRRKTIVELDESMIFELEAAGRPDLEAPTSLDLAFSLCATSPKAIDQGDFLLVISPSAGTHSAGRMLARFADTLDADSQRAMFALSEKEQERLGSNAILAELHYRPTESRLANVMIRPGWCDYALLLDVRPGFSSEKTILPKDILVGVRANRFYLRWKEHDIEIVPRCSHMLNVRRAPLVCRFLSEVALDGRSSIGPFHWSTAKVLPFLPRLQSGRVVLSLARWRLTSGVLSEPIRSWRKRWCVPRRVYWGDGEGRRLIDLENQGMLDELFHSFHANQSPIVLQEALPDVNHTWVKGPKGLHSAEFVVPLLRTLRPDSNKIAMAPRAAAQPSFGKKAPSSDWLYLKLYMEHWLMDDFIAEAMLSFCNSLRDGGIEEWFFVRYADPCPHIRLRIHSSPSALNELYSSVCGWTADLINAGICSRFSIDTYDREIERYGGEDGMRLAEQFFAADSIAVASLLRERRFFSEDVDRVSIGVLAAYQMLLSLGLKDESLAVWLRKYALKERASGGEYRERKSVLIGLLTRLESTYSPVPDSILRDRNESFRKIGEKLQALSDEKILTRALDDVYRSYLHMHCNRLFSYADSAEERILALLSRTHRTVRMLKVHSEASREYAPAVRW